MEGLVLHGYTDVANRLLDRWIAAYQESGALKGPVEYVLVEIATVLLPPSTVGPQATEDMLSSG